MAEKKDISREDQVGGPELRRTSPEAAMASFILWPSRLGQMIGTESHKGLLPSKSQPRRMGLYFSQMERNSVHASREEEK